MQVWHWDDVRPVPGLRREERDRPQPEAGELLIRVAAAGVTPTEVDWSPTTHERTGGDRRGAVPGHEFSGVVEAHGPAAADDGPQVGDAVFGMNDWFVDGATAEFCCAPASAVAPKPARLTHAEAASAPIGALTAWQGLVGRARLQAGERVLIHGGSGAVGVYAVQLARRLGARVIATASARNRDFLGDLGAESVVDYHTQRFEDFSQGVDVVFDAVGGPTLERSWDLLRPGGRMVTVAAAGEGDVDERTKRAFFIVEPDARQLREIAALFDSGQWIPVVDAVVPFAQADAAYSRTWRPRLGRGKMVVSLGLD